MIRSVCAFGLSALLVAPLARGESARGEPVVRVRVDGGVRAVPLEAYVERSVASEVYATWPAEALKAQAVVTRSYALYERASQRDAAWDVESSVLSQRYAPASPVAASIRLATRQTRGQVLSFAGEPILAAFHASSGGRTASAAEVWGLDLPYLRQVPSPDDEAPDYFWSYQVSLDDLRAALIEAAYPRVRGDEVRVLERSRSGRVTRVRLAGAELSGRELRQVLGGRAIRSARFDVRSERGGVLFLGSGAGHGVGLCQWGARELALRGQSYTEILAHYYPGTELQPFAAVTATSVAKKGLE